MIYDIANKGDTVKKAVSVMMLVLLLLSLIPVPEVTSVEMRTENDHDVRITGTRTKPTSDTTGDIDGDGLTDIIVRNNNDVYVLLGKHIAEPDSEMDITTDYSIKFDNTNTEITCLIPHSASCELIF
ncbi:MAG: FG-GAP repeat protein, partial [Candidatus Thermoplasmatota archaeon]|nr:FG-GAP repeat protein [Candidatus Thermoplasmatota archaeon]